MWEVGTSDLGGSVLGNYPVCKHYLFHHVVFDLFLEVLLGLLDSEVGREVCDFALEPADSIAHADGDRATGDEV